MQENVGLVGDMLGKDAEELIVSATQSGYKHE